MSLLVLAVQGEEHLQELLNDCLVGHVTLQNRDTLDHLQNRGLYLHGAVCASPLVVSPGSKLLEQVDDHAHLGRFKNIHVTRSSS